MISRYTYQGLTWIDLENPTKEEILHISEEFAIPSLVGEELSSNTLRSKVDLYDTFIYLVLHFPLINKSSITHTEQEIDFIVGKDFLITTRYELVDSLHEFSKIFEVNSLLDRERMSGHAGFIFMEMMKNLYKTSLRELEDITRTIKSIEHHIFTDEEESMVKQLSHTARKLLDFKQAIRFHKDILYSYESASKRFFGEGYAFYASAITAEFNKVTSVLDSHQDVLTELRRTNDSLLSTKQNGILRIFTIMNFVMLPLSFMAALFTMNVHESLILIQTKADYLLVIGAMALMGCAMFIFFKSRKWL